ncbi:MAG TPA: FAD-dependent oxidoreductase [Vicinamibacterales bacterium]|nr:FAD-dependent oxidoreductase [Vicinamibacterales bacterium]
MHRDIDRLGRDVFDLLIVGGGIYGLATAREAAVRGLSVALVERDDFGARTSFNHHKTIHGGLRYLPRGDVARMRESLRERRAFARMAPQCVRPLPFVYPTSRSLTRGRLAMRAAFAVDRMLGADRNRGVHESLHLPPGRVLTRRELIDLVPPLERTDATGGALWYEYETEESERLTMAFALAAARAGAVLVNYVEAILPCREGSCITGMRVRDVLTGETCLVRARITCNAAGAGAGRIMASFGIRRPFPLMKAMNVLTSRAAGSTAYGVATREGRLLVALPWRGRLAIGTWHGRELAGADAVHVQATELDEFLGEINDTMPWLELGRQDITLVHRGLVPARPTRRGPRFLERNRVIDHATEGVEGAISIVGVKYTTARAAAARAVDLARAKLGLPDIESRTDEMPLFGGGLDVGTDGVLSAVTRLYDEDGARRIADLAAAHPELAAPLAPGVPAIGAQVIEAVRHELAVSLEDVVLRRTALGSAGYPGDEAVRAAAAIMAAELGWSEERIASEIEGVRRYYEIPEPPGSAGQR